MRICIPVRERNLHNLKKEICKATLAGDLLEVWLDTFEVKDVKSLLSTIKKELIIVNKGKEEKGNFIGSEKARIAKLMEALDLKPDYLDLNISLSDNFYNNIYKLKGKTKFILSYHNFISTPSIFVLKKFLAKMLKRRADIVKFACFVENDDQLSVLLKFLFYLKEQKVKFVLTGMGKKGKIIRVLALFFGAEFTYAPLNSEKNTASAQLTVSELKNILHLLN